MVKDKEVLELATGPGLLAKHIAPAAKTVLATDYSDGMIAPNFVEHKGTFISRVWSRILRIAGVRFEHQWSAQEYLDFLENHGWYVTFSKEMAARIALMYAECKRGKERGTEI